MAQPCNVCAAVVTDFDVHNAWHASLSSSPPAPKPTGGESAVAASLARMERNAETIAEEPPPDFDAAKAGVRSVSRLLKAEKP